jgi:O-methyltransferase involved in polyketide biosynthesis
MRRNQTSMTAIGIAILRGIESEKPAGERLCYDPYARRFVNPALYHLVRFLSATYLTGPNAARTVAYGYAIASAVVKP